MEEKLSYLEYVNATGYVVSIHEHMPKILLHGHRIGKTPYFKPNDEFEYYISVNEVDENGFITSHSTIRQAPSAKLLLEKNAELLISNAVLSNYILDMDFRLIMLEFGL